MLYYLFDLILRGSVIKKNWHDFLTEDLKVVINAIETRRKVFIDMREKSHHAKQHLPEMWQMRVLNVMYYEYFAAHNFIPTGQISSKGFLPTIAEGMFSHTNRLLIATFHPFIQHDECYGHFCSESMEMAVLSPCGCCAFDVKVLHIVLGNLHLGMWQVL